MKRLMVVALCASVAACGGADAPDVGTAGAGFCPEALAGVDAFMSGVRPEQPVPDDERYGGTAVVGHHAELTSGMNAAVASDYGSTQYQTFANLMTLVRYDEDLAPQPYLARSWHVNQDTTEITFRLRDDVFWHDGERTDAHDVAFTYGLVIDPRTGFPNPGYFDLYESGAEGMTVIDDFTVTIGLRPHAEFMDPWRALAILPEHLLGDVPAADIGAHPYGSQCPVGNGPFVFVEHRPQDRWVFEANPAFPQELGGRPYLDRLIQRIVPEQTTLLTELLTGGIDVFIGTRPDQAEQILADGGDVRHFPHREIVYIAWNSRRPQLSDPRVRTAITMATNRRELVDATLLGFGVVANSTVPPFHWAYDPDVLPDVPHDPVGARRLLDEAGWTDVDGDGIRENRDGAPLAISIKYNTGNRLRQDIAEIMQAQLSEVGIDVRPTVVETAALSAQVLDPEVRDFDGVVFGWFSDFRMDDRDLLHSDRLDGMFALSGTRNPELDRLLDTLQVAVDPESAKPLWDEYQRAQAREHPYTLLFFPERVAAVSRRLQGVIMDVRGEWVSVRDWWVDPSQR
jgi:peptide/nickel transport system substrate-binding protein